MIEVNNLTRTEVDEEFLKVLAKKVLKEENGRLKGDLSIAIVGRARMRDINLRCRGINKSTDVLAFAADIGEIVICLEEVKKNIGLFKEKSNFKYELARVLVHGILHLLGYDHEKSKKEAIKMKNKENKYIRWQNSIL